MLKIFLNFPALFSPPPPENTNVALLAKNFTNNAPSCFISDNQDTLTTTYYFGIEALKKITIETLKNCSKSQNTTIYIMLPPTNPELLEVLKFIFYSFPDLHVKHLICMQQEVTNNNDNHYNLTCLYRILPLLFYSNAYEPYVYYGTPEVMDNLIMPYYLITEESLINYSDDLKSAVFYATADESSMNHPESISSLISFYRQQFLSVLAVSAPLFKTLEEDMANYIAWSVPSKLNEIRTFTLSSVPCLGYFLTPELAKKYVASEYPYKQRLITSLENRNRNLKAKSFHAIIFFTKEGLQEFVDTGLLSDCPSDIYKKPEEKDRLFILTSAYNAIHTGNLIPYLIDTATFSLSSMLKASIYKNRTEQLFLIIEHPYKGLRQFMLLESSISNALIDFIESLPDSDYVLPAESALKCFQDAIQQLKERSRRK